MDNVTKESLVADIIKLGYLRSAAEEIVDRVFAKIVEEVVSGHKVRIAGFGVFELKKRAPRTARNPRTNEPVLIPARELPVFTPGKEFKNATGGNHER